MSTPAPAIPIHCVDAEDWPGIVSQIQATGSPVDMTPPAIGQLVSFGVMAQFSADASGQFTGMKGLFSDQVIASVGRHVHSFGGAVPQSVSIQLVGLPADHEPGHVTLRIRLKITVLRERYDICGRPVLGHHRGSAVTRDTNLVPQLRGPGGNRQCGLPVLWHRSSSAWKKWALGHKGSTVLTSCAQD